MKEEIRKALQRPGPLLLTALFLVAAVPFVLLDLVGDLDEARAVAGDRDCAETSSPCVERRTATLDYFDPGGRRTGPVLAVEDEDGDRDVVSIVRGYDDYLGDREGDQVEVWRVDGEVVAVIVGDLRFDSEGSGHRGAVSDGFLAGMLLVFALVPASNGWRNRHLGWETPIPESAARMPLVARWLLLPLALPCLAMWSGAPAAHAFVLAGVSMTGVAAYQLWRRHRRQRRRTGPGKHARLD